MITTRIWRRLWKDLRRMRSWRRNWQSKRLKKQRRRKKEKKTKRKRKRKSNWSCCCTEPHYGLDISTDFLNASRSRCKFGLFCDKKGAHHCIQSLNWLEASVAWESSENTRSEKSVMCSVDSLSTTLDQFFRGALAARNISRQPSMQGIAPTSIST